MPPCRAVDSSQFLAGALDRHEEATFTDHLETCDACRRWLEEAAGSAAEWDSARELLVVDGTPGGAAVGGAPPTLDLSIVAFLAPTDDPAMVGRIGPYEISGFLGRGATGIVLKGFDRPLHRNVAIKVLDPALAGVGSARQRFAREARAMAAISHEHVVPVYGVDEHAGLPYFVMEYVAGGSLEKRLATDGPLDVVSIVRIGLQTAQALAAAHAQGLVHRDIKPGNILIDHGTERIRVADFGLARVANDVSCTRSGFVAGTPQYMAPEQVRGETCGPASDLFSLGAVLYALCTGHAPFRAETIFGVMQRIVHDAPRAIREQNPRVPEWLEQFIGRLLAKAPTERFARACDVVRLLKEELAHLQNPVVASEPARPWMTRPAAATGVSNRGRRLIAAGCLAATLATGGAIAWWMGPERTDRSRQSQSVAGTTADGLSADSIAEEGLSADSAEHVPLWNADRFREALAAASALEATFHAPSHTWQSDPWEQEAAQVRRRLADLSREMEPSKSNRGHAPSVKPSE